MEWEIQLQVLGEVALAMLLGGVIGLERELANKPAGFRTHLLVAGGAALLVGLGDVFVQNAMSLRGNDAIRSDPIRIVEAIITGISFLGAGTIFRQKDGEHVEGLTTAATILFAAAVGISVALHQLALAIGATVLCLIALRALHKFELWIKRKRTS